MPIPSQALWHAARDFCPASSQVPGHGAPAPLSLGFPWAAGSGREQAMDTQVSLKVKNWGQGHENLKW